MISFKRYFFEIVGLTLLITVPAAASVTYTLNEEWSNGPFNIHDPRDHMAFEEEFGCEIPDDAAEKIVTVKDAVSFIESHS